ncbi:MAG: family 1 glycosylhydrolase [Candidatus Doudnabacteria bacterium]|nr:family 1 glycosylhydrolase [Candidatus Doudnabacteria bacterium]
MDQSETKDKIIFPSGFLLGAAAAAHQVEGDNINSDWWIAEQQGKLPKSGIACDHYHKFDEDFGLAHDMGLNAMRISIEWARIEPEEGQWDKNAIEHYKKVLKSMQSHGLTRMVTLWHWTLPRWLAEQGGFESKKGVEAFARFAWFVAQNLGQDIDLWVTLNEPEVYAANSHQQGIYPPFKKDLILTWTVIKNLISAHKAAYRAIKGVLPQAQVGIAKNSAYYEAYRKNNLADRIIAFLADRISNHYFLEKIHKQMDFVGINYYFYNRIKFDWQRFYREMNLNFKKGQMQLADQENRSDMGWFLYPEGIYHLLLDLKKYKLPIYVTENGLADALDSRRPQFLRQTLEWIKRAIAAGCNVRGYFHWSLTDNFEWAAGFGPRFGLVEIDYATQKRTVRKSAAVFKEVAIEKN